MTRRDNYQSGFGALEVLALVAVVVVISAVGWFAYKQHHHKTSVVSESTTNTSQTSPKQTTSSNAQATQPAQQYLAIKEWGVELPLSSTISDAYYAVPLGISPDADGKPSGINLGLTSLNNSCGTVSSSGHGADVALGGIVRVLPTTTDPVSGKLYTQLDPNGTTINGYYYGYGSSSKGSTCASASTFSSIDSAFGTATKSMVAAPAN